MSSAVDLSRFDSNVQSIIFGYAADKTAVSLSSNTAPTPRNVFYRALAGSIREHAEKIHALNTTDILGIQTLSERFRFPAISRDKEAFALEVFQRMKALAQEIGVPLEESDLDFLKVLENTDTALFIHDRLKPSAPYLGMLMGVPAVWGTMKALGLPTGSEFMGDRDPGSISVLEAIELTNIAYAKVVGESWAPVCQIGILSIAIGAATLGYYAGTKDNVVKCATNFFHRFAPICKHVAAKISSIDLRAGVMSSLSNVQRMFPHVFQAD